MSDQSTGLLSPWLRTLRIKAARPFLKGRILDYGCGVGALAAVCQSASYFGMDIDEESLHLARSNHPGFRFESAYPDSERFDTVILLAVIEHIQDPVALLLDLETRLNTNGCFVLTTPHPLMDGIHFLGSKLGLFSSEANEQHEQLLNAQRMSAIAAKAGLRVSKYKRFLLGANQLFILKRAENVSDQEKI